jgi:hypothetical protein
MEASGSDYVKRIHDEKVEDLIQKTIEVSKNCLMHKEDEKQYPEEVAMKAVAQKALENTRERQQTLTFSLKSSQILLNKKRFVRRLDLEI